MTDADLQRIYNESRDRYMKIMQHICSPDTPSATQENLRGFHRDEVKAAVASFRAKAKALEADAKTIDQNVNKLTEELNKHEKEFFDLNSKKTEKTVARAIEAYFKGIEKFTHGTICVNQLDVENLQAEGMAAFKKAFKADRIEQHAGEDWDMNFTLDYLLMKAIELRMTNTRNNKLYGFEVSLSYFREMLAKCTGISTEEFNSEHEKSRVKALAVFDTKRNRTIRFKEDSLKFHVEQYILLQYCHLKQINANGNREVVQRTVAAYEQTALAPDALWRYCIHPDELKKNHDDALCRTLQACSPNRACTNGFNDSDRDELNIHLLLENRFRTLADINRISNEIATQAGFLEFRLNFNTLVNRNGNWYSMSQAKRHSSYDKAIVVGVDTFYSKRRDRNYLGTDLFMDNMINKCRGYAQV